MVVALYTTSRGNTCRSFLTSTHRISGFVNCAGARGQVWLLLTFAPRTMNKSSSVTTAPPRPCGMCTCCPELRSRLSADRCVCRQMLT